MKKIFIAMLLGLSTLFASFDINSATKEDLIKIKGIGIKKATALIEYRKTHTIKNLDELVNIKGFGKKLVQKIKTHIKNFK